MVHAADRAWRGTRVPQGLATLLLSYALLDRTAKLGSVHAFPVQTGPSATSLEPKTPRLGVPLCAPLGLPAALGSRPSVGLVPIAYQGQLHVLPVLQGRMEMPLV